jgi:phosphopantetheine--protein transferase-like protein
MARLGSVGKDTAAIARQQGPETTPEISAGIVPNTSAPENRDPPATMPGAFTCGIDIQDIAIFPEAIDYWTEPFYQENFTGEEIAYCVATRFPRQHFAARWCVKEALRKNSSAFLSLPFTAIQIKKRQDGSVFVETCAGGTWRRTAASCSMSHTEHYAVGMVVLYE